MNRKEWIAACRSSTLAIIALVLLAGGLVFTFERQDWRDHAGWRARELGGQFSRNLVYLHSLLHGVALRCARGEAPATIASDMAHGVTQREAIIGLACYSDQRYVPVIDLPLAILPRSPTAAAAVAPPVAPDLLRRWAAGNGGGHALQWLTPQRPLLLLRVSTLPLLPRTATHAVLAIELGTWLQITPEHLDAHTQLALWFRTATSQLLIGAPIQETAPWPMSVHDIGIVADDARWLLRVQARSGWRQYRGSLLVTVAGLLLAGLWWRRSRDLQQWNQISYQAFLRSLSEMDLGLVSIEQQRIRFVNERLSAMTGFADEDLRQLPNFIELFHPDERSKIMSNHLRRLAGEQFESHYDTALHTFSGRRLDVEMSVARLKLTERLVVVLLLRDISARKQAEAALRKHRAQLQSLVEAAPLPMVLSRLSDKAVLFTNPHASRLFKVSLSDAQAWRSVDFLVDDAARREIRQQLRAHGMLSDYEVRYRDAEGRVFWAMISAQTLDYAGEPCVLVAINDITSRRECRSRWNFWRTTTL